MKNKASIIYSTAKGITHSIITAQIVEQGLQLSLLLNRISESTRVRRNESFIDDLQLIS